MFENKTSRSIPECNRNKLTVEWRKLHNEEHNPASFNFRIVKPRKTGWAIHVTYVEDIIHRGF
jgi:hypothetical protein